MPRIHHFVPVSESAADTIARPDATAVDAKGRKRRRGSDTTDRSDTDTDTDSSSARTSPPPPANFPHQSLSSAPRARAAATAGLASESDASLHKQHRSVLTSILHRSLLKGDHLRAGQAFGLLLRSSTGKIDIRANGQWGIGAEILFRLGRDPAVIDGDTSLSNVEDASSSGDEHDSPAQRPPIKTTVPTSTNFQAAKDYYDQLILQFPYSRTQPNAVDARSFYPALFGLCIFEATETANAALRHLEAANPSFDDTSSTSSSASTDDNRTHHEQAEIRRAELRAAQSIASRMDDLLISPPYDRSTALLRLRGMVALWTADILDQLPGMADSEMLMGIERDKAAARFNRVRELGGAASTMTR